MPDIERDVTEIKTSVAEMRVEMKSVWKRLDEEYQLTKSVHELALSSRDMASEIKHLREEQAATRRDLDELKARPAKRWDTIVMAVITGIVGIVVGLLFKGGI